MKVLWHGFAGGLHSWSIVAQSLSREFKKNNYDIDIFSTNGINNFPEDLKENLAGYIEEGPISQKSYIDSTKKLLNNYDIQCSYTAMSNFPFYFQRGSRNRFGIWCYEFAGKNALPNGFAKNHLFVDKILAPSNNAKEIFVDSKIPEHKVFVLPHGYSESFVNRKEKLNISNKFIFGANIAQPHLRKNILGILESWGKAFTKKDDVCLVFKINSKFNNKPFEVNFNKLLKEFKLKYKDHAEIIVIDKFIEDISDFYRSCNVIFSLSNAESFLMPALETLASKKLLICSNYGGQLDFCNESNSLLVSGKMVRANPNMLYWQQKNTFVFEPNIDDAVSKLKNSYNNYKSIIDKIDFNPILEKYSWSNIFKTFEGLIK
jgi:hypothetical protein